MTPKERMPELTSQGAGREDGRDRRLEIDLHDLFEDIAGVTVRSAAYHGYANTLWQLR